MIETFNTNSTTMLVLAFVVTFRIITISKKEKI